MKYRRARVPGGTYFFTVNLAQRDQTLLVDYIDVLRQSINLVKKAHPFKLDAMVVLPEHLHAVITLPENDEDYSNRWMLIKAGFSRGLPKQDNVSNSRENKRERGIWQRRFWEHLIRDEGDFERHVDYVHYNPVKHGLVDRTVDWPFSTFHDFVDRGILAKNWGHSGNFEELDFGENV